MNATTWTEIVKTLLVVSILLSLIALILLALMARRLRRLRIPPEAGPIEVLQVVPLSLVVVLDLLDLGLDVLSAPISWFVLGRLGLGALRGITVVEAVIPGTQFLPTMTAAWLFARFVAPKAPVEGTARTVPDTPRLLGSPQVPPAAAEPPIPAFHSEELPYE